MRLFPACISLLCFYFSTTTPLPLPTHLSTIHIATSLCNNRTYVVNDAKNFFKSLVLFGLPPLPEKGARPLLHVHLYVLSDGQGAALALLDLARQTMERHPSLARRLTVTEIRGSTGSASSLSITVEGSEGGAGTYIVDKHAVKR
jgi:hypothetical protein